MEYRIDTPKNVNFIIKLLEREGFEAFAVGGCVRDALMGNEPQDWDITTSAAPLNVKNIFHKTIDTGLQHGTVTVMLDHIGYEVTTYRIDGSYTDGRHPDQVLFTDKLVEDLKRRDFTINAMAYNERVGIVDEFDGMGDLERGLIKCVGNPVERFTEDALRMLRAVRFAAKLGFEIEENTAKAIKSMAPNIRKVSKERIQSELNKLIMSDNPEILIKICELGMDKYILDESVLVGEMCDVTSSDDTELSNDTVKELIDDGYVLSAKEMYMNIIRVMQHTAPDHYLRWAAFMMYEGDKAKTVLKKLKFDNKTINICSKLVENIEYFVDFEEQTIKYACDEKAISDGASDVVATKKYLIRKILVSMGADIFEEYYLPFMKAVVRANVTGDMTFANRVNVNMSEQVLSEIETLYHEIIAAGDCIAKNKMAVKGTDLIELGVEPGKVMGEVIDKMFEEILKDPSMNDREKLLELLKYYN